MKFRRSLCITAALAAATMAFTGCASNEKGASQSGSSLSGTFNGSGASSQEVAQHTWSTLFQVTDPNAKINYEGVGSGAGRTKFMQGAVTFAGSDSALSDKELSSEFKRCAPNTKGLDLPVYVSPIALAFNLDGVDELNLDSATLAAIFKGDIKNWNDPQIAALNPNAQLPNLAITAIHRSDDSGTTKNFTDYLSQTAPDVWTEKPADKFPYPGESAQGTSGVVQAIKAGKGTIGYADASRTTDLHNVSLKVGDTFQKVSSEGAVKVVEKSPLMEGRAPNDIAVKLDRKTTEAGAYPLLLVSYLVVCQQYQDPKDAEFIKSYASYVISPAAQDAGRDKAGAAEISDGLRNRIKASLDTIH